MFMGYESDKNVICLFWYDKISENNPFAILQLSMTVGALYPFKNSAP